MIAPERGGAYVAVVASFVSSTGAFVMYPTSLTSTALDFSAASSVVSSIEDGVGDTAVIRTTHASSPLPPFALI